MIGETVKKPIDMDPYSSFFSCCHRHRNAEIHNLEIHNGVPVITEEVRVAQRHLLRKHAEPERNRHQRRRLRDAAIAKLRELENGTRVRILVSGGLPEEIWVEVKP